MAGRDPVAAFLTGLRLTLRNPLVKAVLKPLDLRVGDEYVIDQVLRLLAGADGGACPIARLYTAVMKPFLVNATRVFGGDYSMVEEALRDPAIRRGLSTVFRGLIEYGVTVPQRLPAPFLVVWNFTNMCNFRCKHCYQRADKPLPTELSLREKLRVVADLDAAGVAAIALSGGEPTIHPDFFPVVRAAASRGMYVAVATNGWMLADEKFAEKAKKAGVRYVEISIDSADPDRHDRFRGVPGAWRRAVQAARNCVKLGIHTAIAVTLTRYNLDEIDDLIGLAEEVGAQKIVFFNFIPVGRGVDIIDLDLDPWEREKALRKLFRENSRRKVTVLSTAPQYARVSIQESRGKIAIATHFYEPGADPVIASLAEYIGGCGAGRIYAAIEPEGTLTPCVFMPIRIGNLREESFSKLWRRARLFQELRDRERLHGVCGRCPYRYVCGGCRARAYAYLGDPLGPDPGCIYNHRVWERLVEEASRIKKELYKRTAAKPLLTR